MTVFVYILEFIFLAFLAQKLIYTINVWFNFVLGLVFIENYLLSLIILGGYAKGWTKCARISKKKLMYLKIQSVNFFLTLTVRGAFHRKDFKWKKVWGYGSNFWENWSFVCKTYWKSGSSHE